MPGGTVVLIVENDPARVEAALNDGLLACPHCNGELRPWGWATARTLRRADGVERHRPRRSRCSSCKKTSVLLRDVALARRLDEAAVIGTALLRWSAGASQRRIASLLARPRETVRGWLQRFAERAEALAAHFTSWAFALTARLHELSPQPSPVASALEAIGLATRAASTLLGPRPVWSWASAMTAGALLANTSPPFPRPR
jgi:transposase-like protein